MTSKTLMNKLTHMDMQNGGSLTPTQRTIDDEGVLRVREIVFCKEKHIS